LLCHVFWLYANILEEHTAYIYRAEVRSVGKRTACTVGVRRRIRSCVQANGKEPFSRYQRGKMGQEREKEETQIFQGQGKKVGSRGSLALGENFLHFSGCE
jgi:hypothetical protein